MPNSYFQFKQFTVYHDRCAMKVTTDGCLFGAWIASEVQGLASSQVHLLDVGTGTGLLSLMVAQKNEAMIDAVEIDASAAQQAMENIAASPWKERITVFNKDVLQWQPSIQYEFIISNPPFYENSLKSDKAHKNIAHHDEGLRLVDLLRFIAGCLTNDGTFFLLLPANRMTEAEELLKAEGFFLHQKIGVCQTPNHGPFRVMFQGGRHKPVKTTESTLIIKDQAGEYAAEAVALLKDYYLCF